MHRDGEFLHFIRTGGLFIDLPVTKEKHLLLQCFLVVVLGNVGVVFFVAIFKNLLFLIHTSIRIESFLSDFFSNSAKMEDVHTVITASKIIIII